jgi:hypothetical protein
MKQMKRFAFSLAVLLLAAPAAWADIPPPPPPPPGAVPEIASSLAAVAGLVAVILIGLRIARGSRLRPEPQG